MSLQNLSKMKSLMEILEICDFRSVLSLVCIESLAQIVKETYGYKLADEDADEQVVGGTVQADWRYCIDIRCGAISVCSASLEAANYKAK